MSIVATPGLARAKAELDDRWLVAEGLLAAFCVFVVAARINLGGNLVAADPLAWLMLPLWLPVLARYRGARSLLALGLLACVSSWLLSRGASVDHRVSMKLNSQVTKLLLSALTSTGLLLWAREHLRMHHLFAVFGVGMLVAGPDAGHLVSGNIWKFYLSVPLTVLVVGWLADQRRPRLTLGLLLALCAACVASDARSNLAVLLLVVVLIGWRLLPPVASRRTTVWGTIATMVAVAVAAYYALQAAILDGALGEETRQRSVEQLRVSGSLLTGGRPELGASLALFRHRPQGFGGGTYLDTTDLLVAKGGMVRLGYDPNNGYVERFMFGRGIELHSTMFDLWAWCGVVGILFAAVVAVQVLFILGHQLNHTPVAGAVVIFAAMLTLWNLPFSPWHASMPILVLVLGTGLVRRPPPRVYHRLPGAPRRAVHGEDA